MRIRCAVVCGLLVVVACGRTEPAPESSPLPQRPASTPYDEARRLLEQGQADAALAALGSLPPVAESLYLQGAAWAKKAETAPLPTPPPAPSPLPRGYAPLAAPEFKEAELQALSFLEQAVGAEANHARAHQSIADLLAPHAIRRAELLKASSSSRPRPKRGKPEPPPLPSVSTDGPDASPERVIREYQLAITADPASAAPVEALISFCERTDRASEAEAAFTELQKREREKPEPFVRYGDFLMARHDFEGAIGQYRQALMWKADDEATKAKIGEIYIAMAQEHLVRQEYGSATERLREASKWVKDKSSPAGVKLQAALAELAQIRRGR